MVYEAGILFYFYFLKFAKKVMFSSALFCLLAGLCKTTKPIFAKFDEKVVVVHEPWKKQTYFAGNPDHLRLGLGLG